MQNSINSTREGVQTVRRNVVEAPEQIRKNNAEILTRDNAEYAQHSVSLTKHKAELKTAMDTLQTEEGNYAQAKAQYWQR